MTILVCDGTEYAEGDTVTLGPSSQVGGFTVFEITPKEGGEETETEEAPMEETETEKAPSPMAAAVLARK